MIERNFIDELVHGPTWQHILLLSYDFEPRPFFEVDMLHFLQSSGNLTVGIDHRIYRRIAGMQAGMGAPQLAGVRYNLESIEARNGGAFHPKFYLFVCHHELRFSIGSANLTASGFKRNLETMVTVSLAADDLQKQEAQVLLGDVRYFLENYLGGADGPDCSPNFRAAVNEILATEWFSPSEGNPETGTWPRLVAPSAAGMLPRVLELLPSPPSSVEVASPYYDHDGTALRWLANRFEETIIYAPLRGSTLPMDSVIKCVGQLALFGLECVTDRKDRFIHAKTYRLQCSEGSYRLITSANCTAPGLLAGTTQNIEVGILLREEPATLFFAGKHISAREALPQEFDRSKESKDEGSRLGDKSVYGLRSAVFCDEKIRFEVTRCFEQTLSAGSYVAVFGPQNKAKVLVAHDEVSTPIPLGYDGHGQLSVFFEPTQSEGFPTNVVFVSRPKLSWQPLPTLSFSAYQDCKRIGGLEGILKAIEYARRLGRHDWLTFLLMSWDLRSIYLSNAPHEDREEEENHTVAVQNATRNTLRQVDFEKLRQNLHVVYSNALFSKNLVLFLQELSLVFTEGVATEKAKDKAMDASLPVCVMALQLFQARLAEQKKRKGKAWPYYRYLHVLREADEALFHVSIFLTDLSRSFSEASDCESQVSAYLMARLLALHVLWEAVRSDEFTRAILEDRNCVYKNIFTGMPDAEERLLNLVCENQELVSRRRDRVFGLFEQFGIECPYDNLLER